MAPPPSERAAFQVSASNGFVDRQNVAALWARYQDA
jgi:hypothetical protein